MELNLNIWLQILQGDVSTLCMKLPSIQMEYRVDTEQLQEAVNSLEVKFYEIGKPDHYIIHYVHPPPPKPAPPPPNPRHRSVHIVFSLSTLHSLVGTHSFHVYPLPC